MTSLPTSSCRTASMARSQRCAESDKDRARNRRGRPSSAALIRLQDGETACGPPSLWRTVRPSEQHTTPAALFNRLPTYAAAGLRPRLEAGVVCCGLSRVDGRLKVRHIEGCPHARATRPSLSLDTLATTNVVERRRVARL